MPVIPLGTTKGGQIGAQMESERARSEEEERNRRQARFNLIASIQTDVFKQREQIAAQERLVSEQQAGQTEREMIQQLAQTQKAEEERRARETEFTAGEQRKNIETMMQYGIVHDQAKGEYRPITKEEEKKYGITPGGLKSVEETRQTAQVAETIRHNKAMEAVAEAKAMEGKTVETIQQRQTILAGVYPELYTKNESFRTWVNNLAGSDLTEAQLLSYVKVRAEDTLDAENVLTLMSPSASTMDKAQAQMRLGGRGKTPADELTLMAARDLYQKVNDPSPEERILDSRITKLQDTLAEMGGSSPQRARAIAGMLAQLTAEKRALAEQRVKTAKEAFGPIIARIPQIISPMAEALTMRSAVDAKSKGPPSLDLGKREGIITNLLKASNTTPEEVMKTIEDIRALAEGGDAEMKAILQDTRILSLMGTALVGQWATEIAGKVKSTWGKK